AQREHLPFAKETIAARDGEGHHDPVADGKVAHGRTDLDDFAHELMTQDVSAQHAWYVAIVEVHIRTADRGASHFHDGVARVQDARLGDVLDADLADALPTHRFHSASWWTVREKFWPMKLRAPDGCPRVVGTSPV